MSRALLGALLLLFISGSSAALSSYAAPGRGDPAAAGVVHADLAGQFATGRSPSPVADPAATPEPIAEVPPPTEPLRPPSPVVHDDYPASKSQRPFPTPTESARETDDDQPVTPPWMRVSPPARAPTRLTIPDIEVNAKVVGVARTETGEMEAPGEYDEVGWYRLGASPGETGRAVLAGHVDSKTGPAVFYRLRELSPGAVIEVTLGGSEAALRYAVRKTANYPAHEAPLDRIFGPSDRSELVLITCSGDFDFSRGAYSDRLVIFAELMPEQL